MDKDTYTKVFLKAAQIEPTPEKIKEYKAVWWWNLRSKNTGGLRMTEQALEFLETHANIKTYKIEFPEQFAFTPQVLIWLDNFIDSPFFVNKRHIIVIREKSAFELYLLSGDIRKYGHNKAMNQRLNQEMSPVTA